MSDGYRDLLEAGISILGELSVLLGGDEIISYEEFVELTGCFTKCLNMLLRAYPTSEESIQDDLRPYLLYFRQIQHYLTFLLRFPEILAVPHHSEIQQTLDIITRRETLMRELYNPLAASQKALFTGPFRTDLERCLTKKTADQ